MCWVELGCVRVVHTTIICSLCLWLWLRVGEKMCSCLRGLDAEDKMRGMAAHSRLRAHGLIRDNRYHVDLVKKW